MDEAEGVIGKNAGGKLAMTKVGLRPRVSFSGENAPEISEIEGMHQQAHQQCFIANSVTTEVTVSIRA